MSAPRTPGSCILRHVDGLVDFDATTLAIYDYVDEAVRKATEALTKERDDLRQMLAKASQEEWLKHRATMARDTEVGAIRAERDEARKEVADLRRAAGTFTPEWAKAVWNPLVKLLAEHATLPPGGSTYVEMLNRIIHERADLRARVEAVESRRRGGGRDSRDTPGREWVLFDEIAVVRRALDLTTPFKEGA